MGDTTHGIGARIAERVRGTDPGAVGDPTTSLMTALASVSPAMSTSAQ
jgi:hypothetical protein